MSAGEEVVEGKSTTLGIVLAVVVAVAVVAVDGDF